MKLLLDFESRSRVDLKKAGVYNYASDPSTEILCCALKRDDDPPMIWFTKLEHRPDLILADSLCDLTHFRWLVENASSLHAWNAQFERLMWHYIMHLRLGFPALPIKRWRCSAAQAAALALPRSLAQCGSAVNLSMQKDAEGHKLMLKMCKPQKQPKRGPALPEYIEDEASLIRLGQYCIQDVEAEYALSNHLRPLPESEQRVWELDQEINDRGIGIDVSSCRVLTDRVAAARVELDKEIFALTEGKIATSGQRDLILKWLEEEEDMALVDLRKGTVVSALKGLPEGSAKRLLEIRQSGALSSVAKLPAMIIRSSSDGRARGCKLYHGASTGRWAGQGIQGDNLPRDSYKTEEEVEAVIRGDFEGDAIKAASRCIRGMIVPAPGKQLVVVDYSGIEARILAWLAREETALDVFRKGLDPYTFLAAKLFKVPYESVTKDQRQKAKVPELACGYQGWIGAFRKFEDTYQVSFGDDEIVKEIILFWRESRPKTRELWAGLEQAAFETVKTGRSYKYDRITFGIKKDFLYALMPSGRTLAYPYPTIETRSTPYGGDKEVVTFMGLNSYSRKWERLSIYGGKWSENFTQALARDVLVEGMLTLDMVGLDIVNHIHDEPVLEDEIDFSKQVEKILSQPPAWASDLPLAAEGWCGKRYKK